MAEVSIAIAALAGVGSFVAPCILPMIPAFLAYISGTTVAELAQAGRTSGGAAQAAPAVNRVKVMLNTAFFVLGFSVVFSTLGVLINSVLHDSTADITASLNQVGPRRDDRRARRARPHWPARVHCKLSAAKRAGPPGVSAARTLT